ncbi:sensor histidine kinase [Lachnospiraceae bacterium ZAX-1]
MSEKKEMLFSSVRYKLTVLFFGCFLVPLTLITVIAYVINTNATKNDAIDVNANMLSHISSNVDYLLDDVHSITIGMLTNPDIRTIAQNKSDDGTDRAAAFARAKEGLINLAAHDKNVDAVEVITPFGEILTVSSYYANESFHVNVDQPNIRNLQNEEIWIKDGQLGYYVGDNDQITFVRSMRDINNFTREIGVAAVHIRAYTISRIYEDRVFSENTQTYIVDAGGNIISSNNAESIGDRYNGATMERIAKKNNGNYFALQADKRRSYLFYQKLDMANWYILSEVPVADLQGNNGLGAVILINTLLCAVISLLIVMKYLKRTLAPLSEVSRLMKEIEKENYAIRIGLETNDEIGMLAKSFDHMAQRLDELVAQVYNFEIKQRDAQITLLRSQINPHFLYNVMDIIYWKSRSEKAMETAGIVRDLSSYLRKSITDINTLHSVRAELEHLYYYVNIQKLRYEGRIEFGFKIDEALMDAQTIHFVLQPLVENAIYHGIEQSGGVGQIDIDIHREDCSLVIEVSDDGQGLDIEEMKRLMREPEPKQDNRGLAIRNINDRVQLLYGAECGLAYLRTKDDITVARVVQQLSIATKGGTQKTLINGEECNSGK